MSSFESAMNLHKIMFTIVPLLIAGIFIATFVMILSPKARGKMMSKNIKALKHMTDFSKEDLESIAKETAGVAIRSKKQILDENEELLREINDRQTELETEKLKKKVRAIKEELEGESIYCKHCGKLIDKDSRFCKSCGKAQ